MDKKQREARRRQEDQALNRGLLWVAGAIVLEGLLLLVNRYYINIMTYEIDRALMIREVLCVLRVAGAVVGAIGLLWAIFQLVKGGKAVLPGIAGLVCWAVAFCAHVIVAYDKSGMQMLFLLVPAWAGLALVYYLYQREFFLAAMASGMATVGLWFLRYGTFGFEAGLMLLGIILVAAVTLGLKKTGGIVRLGGREVRAMGKNTSYGLSLVSCLVGAVAMLVAAVLGSGVAYYLIFVMVMWMFVLLVYYTVKLM
ncbi:MAG: hypothetical protein ACOX7N_04315 [Lawsonibacter sp.]|jgi:hypothetical protein